MTRNEKIDRLFCDFEQEFPNANLERLKKSLSDAQPNKPESCSQRPGFLYLPFLPSTPWHEPAHSPWILEFESAYEAVKNECSALYCADRGFLSYSEPGNGPEFWRGSWNTCYFFHSGRWFEEIATVCPVTSGLLKKVPRLDEYALFSAIKPGAHIRPHCGPWNTRLTYHFGIVVPRNCWIRVGDETRGWASGKFIVFDDSFEHEVMNNGEEDRIVLMFTVWHPHLTENEIEFLRRLDHLFPVPDQVGYVQNLIGRTRESLLD